jgi:hypothetical protein
MSERSTEIQSETHIPAPHNHTYQDAALSSVVEVTREWGQDRKHFQLCPIYSMDYGVLFDLGDGYN